MRESIKFPFENAAYKTSPNTTLGTHQYDYSSTAKGKEWKGTNTIRGKEHLPYDYLVNSPVLIHFYKTVSNICNRYFNTSVLQSFHFAIYVFENIRWNRYVKVCCQRNIVNLNLPFVSDKRVRVESIICLIVGGIFHIKCQERYIYSAKHQLTQNLPGYTEQIMNITNL